MPVSHHYAAGGISAEVAYEIPRLPPRPYGVRLRAAPFAQDDKPNYQTALGNEPFPRAFL